MNREPQMENGWGWFVDVDIESSISFPVHKKIKKTKSCHQVSIPKTIRSMQSMRNLCELNTKKEEPHIITTYILHGFGFISFLFCYFIVKQ
jgi:hypothetical protein